MAEIKILDDGPLVASGLTLTDGEGKEMHIFFSFAYMSNKG